MTLTTSQLQLIEQRVANDGPSAGVTFVLWFFLGWLGAHRFYLGRSASAVIQIVTVLLLIGLLWWLIDLFLLTGMIKQRRDEIRQKHMLEMMAMGAGQDSPAAP